MGSITRYALGQQIDKAFAVDAGQHFHVGRVAGLLEIVHHRHADGVFPLVSTPTQRSTPVNSCGASSQAMVQDRASPRRAGRADG